MDWFRIAGPALFAIGAATVIAILFTHSESPVRIRWSRYVADLDRECRFLFLKTNGRAIARVQLWIIGVLLAFAAGSQSIAPLLFGPIVLFAPVGWFRKRHDLRVLEIQKQLDAWLLMLANGLRATPSLGEAIAATARLVHPPMNQELDIVVKEIQLGAPLDRAILSMGDRLRSRSVSSALTTILVGRQTGGDLSRILEESAAMLREMSRLEGVVRMKTAEAKAQTWVLAGMPFVIVGALYYLDPRFLEPLWTTGTGYGILTVAIALWFGAVLLARKTLAVDV